MVSETSTRSPRQCTDDGRAKTPALSHALIFIGELYFLIPAPCLPFRDAIDSQGSLGSRANRAGDFNDRETMPRAQLTGDPS